MDTHFPIIGITGGIGSGKSVVSRLLRALDIPVYDCDTQAKRLTLCSPLIRERLTALLGEEAYCDNGQQLNKPLIADFLFHSAGNAQKLNSIIHPVVRDDFLRWAGQKLPKSGKWKPPSPYAPAGLSPATASPRKKRSGKSASSRRMPPENSPAAPPHSSSTSRTRPCFPK